MTGMGVRSLLEASRNGSTSVEAVIETVFDRIDSQDTNAWITTRDRAAVIEEARSLDDKTLPLYGVPFAVKDNIDYAGLPTTAGCPEYAYEPDEHATVVRRLIDAGAMLIGKTNMDQFATGLVGTRSPYGACHNVYNNAYISGGSSSGSAVATVRGHVAFALGTDTAGSGRVPAAFNGLVGYKPTRGVLSTDGVVPACASLDCVSVFAQDCRDALQVSRVAAGFDPADPYSRREADTLDLDPNLDVDLEFSSLRDSTLGVPAPPDQEFFGDEEAASLFDTTVETLAEIGTVTHVDMEPFYETAALLYGGPWIAERFAAVGEFIEENPDAVDPVVEEIICDRTSYSAVETFEAFQRLKSLTRRADGVMADIDALVVPTTGMTYTIESVRDAPVELNSNLGYYTNFVNLLDLSAVAVPTGQFDAGPTFGVTVIGDAFADATVTAIAAELRAAVTTDQPEPPSPQ